MKKSLIALLVVLALVITVSAFSVSADEPAPASADYTLTITDGVATAACPCPTHNGQVATFTEYTASSALSNGAHYYLSGNVAHTANRAVSTNHTAVIHLNGNTLSCSSNYVFNNWNENTNLYLVADATKGGVVSTSRTHAAVRSSVGNVYSYNVTYTRAAGSPPSGFAGGTIAQQGAGEFHMYGGTINGVVASGNGGAVQITSGTFHMHSGTIQNCSATSGGAVYIGGGTFHMHGGTITGCSASNGGAVYIGGGTFKMAGGDITSCSATTGNGGAVYISGANSKIEMSDGTISNCTAAKSAGGAIYIQYQSTANTFSGGTIQNCSAANGGAVYISGSGSPKLTMSGTAMIDTCSATSGAGAVHIAGNTKGAEAHFEMQNGTIQNCSSPTGGGVRVNGNSIFTMSNGLVTANRSTSSFGGNVRVDNANAIFNISGGTISDGVTAGNGGNLFCNQAAVLNITGGTFSGGSATAEGGNICITNAATTSVMMNAKISGGTSTGTGKNIGAALCLMTGNFSEISGMTFEGGSTASAANTSGAGVLITSGSYTIKNSTFTGGTAYTNGGALLLATSGTTTLEGCTVSGGVARYGSNIYISTGTLNLKDTDLNKCGSGTIINGGAIWVGAATVNMDADSTINGSAAMHGGQICLNNASAVFNLNGGSITNGQAARNNATTTPYGGNVAVLSGTFNMNSGVISGGYLGNSNGAGHGGNVYVDGGTFNLINGTISGGKASTKADACGGNVYIASGTFTMTDGTISGGTAQLNGGNIAINSLVADTPAGTLDINGGELTGGTAVTGGSIYVGSLASAVTVDDATITGGKATSTALGLGGGNIWNALGTTTITNCTIADGVAEGSQGGNIFNAATGLTVTGTRITGGTAGKKVETESTDAETGEPVITVSYPNTHGRGGNIGQTSGSATFTNCVIMNGVSYSGGGGGGNVYLGETIGETIFDGCTITNGYANNQSGNLQHHANGTVIITGDSYIAGGKVGGNWGANIGVSNGSAVLKIDGETEINAAGTSGVTGTNGINIHVAQSNAQLHLLGNSRVVLGNAASYHSIVWASPSETGTGKVYLGGNTFMDKYVELKVSTTTATAPAGCVEVMEGFTGDALVITFTGSNNFGTADNTAVGTSTDVNFGADAPAYLTAAAGYQNTGTVKVHSTGRSGYVVSWTGTKFIIAPYTAFVAQNNGADGYSSHIEYGLANLTDTLPAGTGYVKLYTNTAFALNEQLDGMPIDLNKQTVTIDTNGYTLAPIDYRTDGGDVSATALTVTGDEAKVTLLVTNPVTGFKYLNIKDEETGTWTSNRIRVEMTKVSIKTAKDGIYYTTKIQTNANAAPYLVDYGTAVSLVENVVIDENFLDHLDTNGVLYTAFELDETGNFSIETRSALVSGILSEENDAATNTAHAQMDITANSFVTAMVNGTEVKIMADEAHVLSFEDIMIKLDDKVEELNRLQPDGFDKTIATAVAFYNKWADTFGTWANLPNLKAEAAKAA